MRPILNFGSLNIDHVYTMPQVVAPGQTLPSSSYQVFPGGKGANQSAALAEAGANVHHAGRVGPDGRHLLEGLAQRGVDTTWTQIDTTQATGHAIIQVETQGGENAILLYAGANHAISAEQIHTTLDHFTNDCILLLQNEISNMDSLLTAGAERAYQVAFNPAPFTPNVTHFKGLSEVALLIVNETEAMGIAGMPPAAPDAAAGSNMAPAQIVKALRERVAGKTEVLLTLGARGAVLARPDQPLIEVDAYRAGPVVDTTAAGDTFIGYFLAARARGQGDEAALQEASVAAALCVTKTGAQGAIPARSSVDAHLKTALPPSPSETTT